jgi:hypothetical protein
MQILVEQIFKNVSVNNTLDEIITNNRSISRFGYGEFNLIYEKGIYFQEYNQKLCKKLRKILKSNEDCLLIGIKIPYKRKQLDRYINVVKCYYINFINNNKFQIYDYLIKIY